MARRERVGSDAGYPGVGVAAPAPAQPAQLQSPWGAPAAAHDSAGPQLQTEIAAFSPSPVPDSPTSRGPGSHIDQLEHSATDGSQQGQTSEDSAAAVQSSAASEVLRKPLQLLGTAKQLRASRDHHPLQQKGQQGETRLGRKPKTGTADIHLIGEITGAVGFGSEPLYCTWQLVYDSQLWAVSRGTDKGRTHASCPLLPEDGQLSGVVWETPIDLALTTTSTQHWPSIVFKLFHRSVWLGRDEFVGYSLCNLPSTPGCHHLSCPVWAAVEARRSFKQDFTSWFTGLSPQLADESFITDLEQRYEQGQHLHTRDCSSTSSTHIPAPIPTCLAVQRIGSCTAGAGGADAVHQQLYCRSFSAAGAGGTAAAGSAGLVGCVVGGRICLRLHVLARGLSQLKAVAGGESVGRCLERLRDSVEKMRRHKGQQLMHEDKEVEGEGLRLVREGRAARLTAVQQQLDGNRDRDQQGQQQLRGSSDGYGPSSSAPSYSRGSPGRSSPGRNSLLQSSRYGGGGGGASPGGGSLRGTGRFAGMGEAADSSSPQRVSRAGRLGSAATSSPSRTPNAYPSTSGSAAAAAAGASLDDAQGMLSLSGGLGGAAAGAGGVSSSEQAQQPYSSSLHRGAAPASPGASEQQGLWAGTRSAPIGSPGLAGAATQDDGSPSNAGRGLLRRGAELLGPSGNSSAAGIGSRGVGAAAAAAGGAGGAAASPTGSEGGGNAPLLPFGADRSSGFSGGRFW